MDNENNTHVNEDYEARAKVWENEKRGIVHDLQGERDKRHAAEREVEEMKANLARQEEPPVETNAEVNALAENPKKYIEEVINKTVLPRLEADKREREFEKSYEWAAKQLDKDFDDVRYGKDHESFVRISKENSIDVASDPRKGMKSILKIYKQELKEKELEEQTRTGTIQDQSTERVNNTPLQGKRRWTREMLRTISDADYLKYQDEIGEAERNGQIL